MSIHKSQGQTLDRVEVDLDRVFETGRAYVAISPATRTVGFLVSNFDPSKVAVQLSRSRQFTRVFQAQSGPIARVQIGLH